MMPRYKDLDWSVKNHRLKDCVRWCCILGELKKVVPVISFVQWTAETGNWTRMFSCSQVSSYETSKQVIGLVQ